MRRTFRPPRRRFLSLDKQAARLRLRFGFRTQITGGQLEAHGTLRPAPAGDVYDIRIQYRWDHAPRVFVVSPTLKCNSKGEPPPHRFETLPGKPLCLYYSKDGEWSGHDYLSETIVPWTSEYLVFYELWLASGEWWGGGVDHAPAKEATDA